MNNTCSIKLGFTHENQSKKNVELTFIHKIQVSFGNVQYVYIYMLEEDIFSRYCIALLKIKIYVVNNLKHEQHLWQICFMAKREGEVTVNCKLP